MARIKLLSYLFPETARSDQHPAYQRSQQGRAEPVLETNSAYLTNQQVWAPDYLGGSSATGAFQERKPSTVKLQSYQGGPTAPEIGALAIEPFLGSLATGSGKPLAPLVEVVDLFNALDGLEILLKDEGIDVGRCRFHQDRERFANDGP